MWTAAAGLSPNLPTLRWLCCQSGFLETHHLRLIVGATLLRDVDEAARVRDAIAPLEPARKTRRTKEQLLFTRESETPLQARFTVHGAIAEARANVLNERFLRETERPIQETLIRFPRRLLVDGGTRFPSARSYSDAIWRRFIEPPANHTSQTGLGCRTQSSPRQIYGPG